MFLVDMIPENNPFLPCLDMSDPQIRTTDFGGCLRTGLLRKMYPVGLFLGWIVVLLKMLRVSWRIWQKGYGPLIPPNLPVPHIGG
ncbi:hypothetical protein JTB14_002382 [Gonioctena quinquepunctata]|nr:hypothetical protein JTB14_002382 [Gonioctena quinquepunctata]